ncbi:unnamed protein product [Brugia pahangi]|uniref:Uncharacterized protein n=1 Tax=Brugia pahangi TaxID=6280 RepID=A0A0N4TTT2_BRUPA|nr:unnamed protein product [Brugia pahangi]
MVIIFIFLDIVFPILIILFALCKIHNVSMKWYIINLLAAYCISNIGRYIDKQLEKLLQFDNVIHEIKNNFNGKSFTFFSFHWLAIYLRVASFTLIRLTLFLYIFEIYSIYTLKINIMEVFYKRLIELSF